MGIQTLWIGDFRAKQIQLYNFGNKALEMTEEEKEKLKEKESIDKAETDTSKDKETRDIEDPDKDTEDSEDNEDSETAEEPSETMTEIVDKYLIDDFADCTWFEDNAIAQIPLFAYNSGNVVITLGFNDCVYSCTWEDFYDIEKIAKRYIKAVNKLVEQYAGFIFYFCSVNPVEADYPFAPYTDTGMIPKDVLNEKIKQFNKKIKAAFKKADATDDASETIDTAPKNPDESTNEKDKEEDPDADPNEYAEEKEGVPGNTGFGAPPASVTYINCARYLTKTGFTTRDGIAYTEDSCKHVYNYITSSFVYMSAGGGSLGLTRATEADAPTPGTESWKYWTNPSVGGVNPCKNIKNGCVLPNCVGYAWGRFYEILGSKPTLCTGNAEKWYPYTADGYERGQTPEVGAVICWKDGNYSGYGHVGIVETYDPSTGEIITSESGWQKGVTNYSTDKGFWVVTRVYDPNKNNWRKSVNGKPVSSWYDNGYTFQGFIYNPAVRPSATDPNAGSASTFDLTRDKDVEDDTTEEEEQTTRVVTKDQVVSQDKALNQTQMETNALYIWNYLGSRGWSLNAVAGILGNMECESTINPGRHEVGGSGYGLVQWTPKSNLTSWTRRMGYEDNDIDGQLERIIYEKDNGGQYIKKNYKYTFQEFAVSTDDPYTLACAFAFDYERSWVALYGDSAAKERLRKKRGGAAERWYAFLSPYSCFGGGFQAKFIAENFKIDKLTVDAMEASFIVCNGESAYYSIKDSSGKKLVDNKELDGIASETSNENASGGSAVDKSTTSSDSLDKEQEKTKEKEANNTDDEDEDEEDTSTVNLKTIIFEYDKLVPNTSYTLSIEVKSALGGDTREEEIEFKTPQSFPDPVTELQIESLSDNLVNKPIKLSFKAPVDWGYWKNKKNKSCGYEIHLIVNGRSIASKTLKSLAEALELIPAKYFKQELKIGQTFQIGIRTWVYDSNGKKIFNSDYFTASNPICLLVQPFKMYLKQNK